MASEYFQLLERIRSLEAQVGALVQRGVIESTGEAFGRNPEYAAAAHPGQADTGLERIQDYGFASRPLPGAEAVTLWLNGKRDAALVIASADRRYRLELAEGEVALYDDRGQKVLLHDGGVDVVVDGDLNADVSGDANATVSGETNLICSQTNITGNLFVGGNLVVAGIGSGQSGPMLVSGGLANTGGEIVSNDISLDGHVHTGVTGGSENTGGPV